MTGKEHDVVAAAHRNADDRRQALRVLVVVRRRFQPSASPGVM